MKHRSIGIFIILAASLAAIPQASQELDALRNAVGQRARVELWNAFLDLQSAGGRSSRPAAPASAPAAVAGCQTAPGQTASQTAKASAVKTDDARRSAKEQPRRADEAEALAVIVDPSQGPQVTKVAYHTAEKTSARRASASEPHRGAEFAMFVAPGDAIEIDADAVTRGALPRLVHDRGEWLSRGEIAELEKQAFLDSARERETARRDQHDAERARGEVRRRVHGGPHTKVNGEVKAAEQLLKVFKFKTTEKTPPAAPVAFTSQPGRQIYAPAPAPLPAPPAETE